MFVDFNQNAPHKNVFGAWGVRPRVGAQVSTPIEWDELMDVVPDELTMLTVPDRLAERGDPWADMDAEPQDIGALVAKFAEDIADGIPDAAMAARLSEDAERGAAGATEPSERARADGVTRVT